MIKVYHPFKEPVSMRLTVNYQMAKIFSCQALKLTKFYLQPQKMLSANSFSYLTMCHFKNVISFDFDASFLMAYAVTMIISWYPKKKTICVRSHLAGEGTANRWLQSHRVIFREPELSKFSTVNRSSRLLRSSRNNFT